MSVVLAIDDAPNTLKLMEAQFNTTEHKLFTETSPKKGIEIAKTINPDVILLDFNMPDMNGLDVIKSLRKDLVAKDIPVIMITAVTDKSVVYEAMRYGVLDYIIKPWDKQKLLTKISASVHLKELKKRESMLDNSKIINFSNDEKNIILTIMVNPSNKEFIMEARRLFSPFFFKQNQNKNIVLDLRGIGDMDDNDLKAISIMMKLFESLKVHVVAGRHYGLIAGSDIFENIDNIYISFGDYEIFINS